MKHLLKIFLLLSVILLIHINCIQQKRKKILTSGDLIIGALLPVHEQPNDTVQSSSKRKCGSIRDQYGVQRVEALLYLLDKINNKSTINILPGIKLGLEIRDECWDASIALEETIDFIKETISTSVDATLEEDEIVLKIPSKTEFKNETFQFLQTDNNICITNKTASPPKKKILAVVGPSGSAVAITVQNLLQLFDTPQVGFSATSADLSNKKMYKTFLRVVPSDYLQVQAMIDIVKRMNWTYIFAVYTDGMLNIIISYQLLFCIFDI